MLRKRFQRILSLYFVLSFVLMVSCVGIITADCANKACVGEFKVLPVLNLAQFKTGGSYEEQFQTIPKVAAYDQQLYESGRGYDDPLWRFINICTGISLCNMPLFYIMNLAELKFPRFVRMVMLAGFMIALLSICAGRIYVHNTHAGNALKFRYPVAFITWREIVQTAFILGITVGGIKFYKFIEKNENQL